MAPRRIINLLLANPFLFPARDLGIELAKQSNGHAR